MADIATVPIVKAAEGEGTVQPSPAIKKAAEAPAGYKIIKTTKTATPSSNTPPKAGATKSPAIVGGMPASKPSASPPESGMKQAAKPDATPASTSAPQQSLITTSIATTTPSISSNPNKSPTPPPPAYSEKAIAPDTVGNTTTSHKVSEGSTHHAPRQGFLARLGGRTAQVANAFIPQLEIGDLEIGDVELPSEYSDDDSDTDRDDDPRDKRQRDPMRGGGETDTEHTTEKRVDGNGVHSGTTAATGMLSTVGQGVAQGQQQERRRVVGNGQTVQMETKKSPVDGTTASEKKLLIRETSSKPQVSERNARVLRRRGPTDISRIVLWAIMILLPLLFIILGVLVGIANGRPQESALGQGVNQAIKVGVSAWPIIFAAVAAQSLRTLATWKVERGIKLMTLEQLISSNSVASSFKQPFVLRRFDWITAALFALWSLSPLAGQALVRVQYMGQSTVTTAVDIPYINTEYKNAGFSNAQTYLPKANLYYATASINRLFSAALLPRGPRLSQYQDPYNHPLLPDYDELPGVAPGFKDINYTTNPTLNFTSLYGIPLLFWPHDPTNSSEYSMYITSAYIRFNCTPLKEMTIDDFNATIDKTDENTAQLMSVTTDRLYLAVDSMKGDQMGNFSFASLIDNNPVALRRQEAPSETPNKTFACSRCNFGQVFVETRISCIGDSCLPVKMRRLNGVPDRTYTPSDFSLTTAFLRASGDGLVTDIEAYLFDPAQVNARTTTQFSLMTVPDHVFVQRLSILFNTFWTIGFAPEFFTQPLTWKDIYRNDESISTKPDGELYTTEGDRVNLATQATRTDSYNVWRTDWAWLPVLLASSVILLIAGVASVIWDRQIIAPDILGFASSVARKSKYVDLPAMDSTMSGAERARHLRDVVVMMQDVKPKAPIGRVALGSWHIGAERLKPERMYR